MGKTTLAKALAREIGAEYVRQPTDGPIGTMVRAALTEDRFKLATIQLLMRADAVENAAWLEQRFFEDSTFRAVTDRSCWSGIAYGDPNAMDTPLPIYPMRVLWLDLPASIALARLQARGEKLTRFETVEKLHATRARYRDLWEKHRNVWQRITLTEGTSVQAALSCALTALSQGSVVEVGRDQAQKEIPA